MNYGSKCAEMPTKSSAGNSAEQNPTNGGNSCGPYCEHRRAYISLVNHRAETYQHLENKVLLYGWLLVISGIANVALLVDLIGWSL